MVFNNLFSLDSDGNTISNRFVKPKHLSRTICWNNEDTEIWTNCGIIQKYNDKFSRVYLKDIFSFLPCD